MWGVKLICTETKDRACMIYFNCNTGFCVDSRFRENNHVGDEGFPDFSGIPEVRLRLQNLDQIFFCFQFQ